MDPGRLPTYRPNIQLLITDLDNTLWDWFDAWYASFSAMLRQLSAMSGVPISKLEEEIRAIHQIRGTAEYSYLLNELPSLIALNGSRPPLEEFDEAVHTQNSERIKATALYPGVSETLSLIKRSGVPIVAYSESIAYWTEWRIKRTKLDGVIDVLYSSPDHDLPNGVEFSDIRRRPYDEYGLKITEHRHTPKGLLKPNSTILGQILSDYSMDPTEVAYVGDSLMKDVSMAQAVGVLDVHAAYGVAQNREGYDLLRRVSHWTQDDIERERRLAIRSDIDPTYQLAVAFSDLTNIFTFGAGSK